MLTKRGFTLIELLVVIAIIGLLASVILASLDVAASKGRDARRLADMNAIETAIAEYAVNNNGLPQYTGWCTYISNPSNGWGAAFQSQLVPTYISKMPLDPTHANQVGDYFYSNDNSSGGIFTLCAILENPSGVHNSSYNLSGCANWTSAYNYCVDYRV